MSNIEEISKGATDGDDQADAVVDPDACCTSNIHEIEVEGIDKESGHAIEEEDAMP